MSVWAREARRIACAMEFLTRLPAPPLGDLEPDAIPRAARYFPLAGQFVGILAAALWLVADRVWPGAPAAILAVAVGILVTGALHEDGLADTADGFGGGSDPARRLAIMKDSRIGVFGALTLVVSVGLRVTLLAAMPPWRGAAALLVVHGGARAAVVAVMAILPYAGDPAMAKIPSATGRVKVGDAALALLLGAWPLLLLSPARAIVAVALAAALAAAMAVLGLRMIGGVTGDVLGAVEQLAEVGLMLGAALGARGA